MRGVSFIGLRDEVRDKIGNLMTLKLSEITFIPRNHLETFSQNSFSRLSRAAVVQVAMMSQAALVQVMTMSLLDE